MWHPTSTTLLAGSPFRRSPLPCASPQCSWSARPGPRCACSASCKLWRLIRTSCTLRPLRCVRFTLRRSCPVCWCNPLLEIGRILLLWWSASFEASCISRSLSCATRSFTARSWAPLSARLTWMPPLFWSLLLDSLTQAMLCSPLGRWSPFGAHCPPATLLATAPCSVCLPSTGLEFCTTGSCLCSQSFLGRIRPSFFCKPTLPSVGLCLRRTYRRPLHRRTCCFGGSVVGFGWCRSWSWPWRCEWREFGCFLSIVLQANFLKLTICFFSQTLQPITPWAHWLWQF